MQGEVDPSFGLQRSFSGEEPLTLSADITDIMEVPAENIKNLTHENLVYIWKVGNVFRVLIPDFLLKLAAGLFEVLSKFCDDMVILCVHAFLPGCLCLSRSPVTLCTSHVDFSVSRSIFPKASRLSRSFVAAWLKSWPV